MLDLVFAGELKEAVEVYSALITYVHPAPDVCQHPRDKTWSHATEEIVHLHRCFLTVIKVSHSRGCC
jgi:hypothetical protein